VKTVATRAAVAFALLGAGAVAAQQLEPRAYSNAPVGMNFLIAGDAYSTGGLSTNPALRLSNARLRVHTPILAYAHAFDAWGKSAKFDAILPAGCISGSADQDGVALARDVCGLVDPAFRLSVNFYGAPALSLDALAAWRQDLVAGASLQVIAPLGQYDPARLVNLGTNRWTFRPEIGLSQAFGSLTLEFALGASVYTTNRDFYGGKVLEQDPMYSAQAHAIYQFRGGAWVALNGTYYAGGRTTLNGVRGNDLQKASRLGVTLALPVDRRNSVKLTASSGVSVRTGTDFDTLGVAWQYRWGGGL
jgi:hypothetical protein